MVDRQEDPNLSEGPDAWAILLSASFVLLAIAYAALFTGLQGLLWVAAPLAMMAAILAVVYRVSPPARD